MITFSSRPHLMSFKVPRKIGPVEYQAITGVVNVNLSYNPDTIFNSGYISVKIYVHIFKPTSVELKSEPPHYCFIFKYVITFV